MNRNPNKNRQGQAFRSRVLKFLNHQWRNNRGAILFFTFVVIPVKSIFADVNWVPTGSMNPTIVEGDMVYIDKMAYDLRFPLTLHSMSHRADPERGDIVVFFAPHDGTRMVKRLIGIPGDEIQMRNNVLFINGEPLDYTELSAEVTRDLEDELSKVAVFAEENLEGHRHAVMAISAITNDKRSFDKLVLPENSYFVMGDNRDNRPIAKNLFRNGRK